MKYFIIIFWTIIFGFVVGFIGAKLTQASFNLVNTLIASGIFGVLLCAVPKLLDPKA